MTTPSKFYGDSRGADGIAFRARCSVAALINDDVGNVNAVHDGDNFKCGLRIDICRILLGK